MPSLSLTLCLEPLPSTRRASFGVAYFSGSKHQKTLHTSHSELLTVPR